VAFEHQLGTLWGRLACSLAAYVLNTCFYGYPGCDSFAKWLESNARAACFLVHTNKNRTVAFTTCIFLSFAPNTSTAQSHFWVPFGTHLVLCCQHFGVPWASCGFCGPGHSPRVSRQQGHCGLRRHGETPLGPPRRGCYLRNTHIQQSCDVCPS